LSFGKKPDGRGFSLDLGKFFRIISCAVRLRKGKFDATIVGKGSYDIEDQTDEGRGAIRMKDWKKRKSQIYYQRGLFRLWLADLSYRPKNYGT